MPEVTESQKPSKASKVFSLRLSDKERDLLGRRAEALAVTPSRLLHMLIQDDAIVPTPPKQKSQAPSQLLPMMRDLSGMANNLNQLTRHANRFKGATNNDELLRILRLMQDDLSRMSAKIAGRNSDIITKSGDW